jgi:hypothetical protein
MFAAVIFIAFVVRMMQPDLVEFKRDEATVSRLGQAIAYEQYRPAVGVDSSLGIDNLPLTLYLMALPLRIQRDPISAVLFTIFLNACAVVVCYWIMQRISDIPTALVTSLLFAVNPWAVLYARKIWCRTMPLFTLGFIISTIAVFVWGKRWAIVGSFISLAALIGLQLEGIAFIPLFLLLLLLYREKITWPPFVTGMLICIFLFLPYILYDARQDWANVQGLLDYSSGGSFSWDALRYAFTLAGTAGIEGQAGGLYRQFYNSVPNLWFANTVFSIVLGVSLVYTVVQVFNAEKQDKRRILTILLLWFVIPVLLQLRSSPSTQRHYFVLLYPVQFMLVGIFVLDVLKWLRTQIVSWQNTYIVIYRIISVILVVALLVWILWQISITVSLRSYMVKHPTTGGYGIPMRYSRSAAQKAVGAANGAEIIVVSDSTHPFMTETPTVFDTLLFGHPRRFVDGRGALPFPDSDRLVYLVRLVSENDLYPLVRELSGLDSVTTGPEVKLPDGGVYATFVRQAPDNRDIMTNLTPISGGISFENNVVFAGYRSDGLLQPGEYLEVRLGWWLHGPPPEGIDYHFTVQLNQRSEGGMRIISQDDQVAYPVDYWQGGDMVLSYFLLPLPMDLTPGSYILWSGMYSYPDIIAVPVINPEGEAVDDGVELLQLEYNGR